MLHKKKYKYESKFLFGNNKNQEWGLERKKKTVDLKFYTHKKYFVNESEI